MDWEKRNWFFTSDSLRSTVMGRGTPSRARKALESCLTLGNELSKETHVLTKQEALLGRGARAESKKVREPGGLPRTWLAVLGLW